MYVTETSNHYHLCDLGVVMSGFGMPMAVQQYINYI